MGATPPAFNPPSQQSGNKVWLWILLIIGVLCVVCGVGGFFACKNFFGSMMGMGSCMVNGELAQNALIAYSQEHDGKLPPAENWQDEIKPYYKAAYDKMMSDSGDAEALEKFNFKVARPGEPLTCDLGGGKTTSFAFNTAVAGKVLKEIENPTTTIMLFEMPSAGYNAAGDPSMRSESDPVLTFVMGEKRKWMDFYIDGNVDPFESSNSKMDFKITPEDAIPPKTDKEGAQPQNPTGA